MKSSKFKNTILITIGMVALILAIIGIIIPLLPTTPFLLLSAACFLKGSDRMYQWLINHKFFGNYIRNFREHKAIPLKTKVLAVSLLWMTILFSIIFIVQSVYLRIMLAAIAIAVSVHILHFKTLKPNG
jgi:hypothetical protein